MKTTIEKNLSFLSMVKRLTEQMSGLVENPRLQAELMLSAAVGVRPLEIYLQPGKSVGPDIRSKLEQQAAERVKGIPLQYLTGRTWFYGLCFETPRGVFIPRPETEVLVEIVLEKIKLSRQNKPSVEILELCVGSGNIAVSLTKHSPDCKILAIDICQKALLSARENARRHGVEKQILFAGGDLFSAILEKKLFDVLVVNPPYLSLSDRDCVSSELFQEPERAWHGGEDGLDYYRRIVDEAGNVLLPGGLLALELGDAQFPEVECLIRKTDKFGLIESHPDLNDIPRVLTAIRNG